MKRPPLIRISRLYLLLGLALCAASCAAPISPDLTLTAGPASPAATQTFQPVVTVTTPPSPTPEPPSATPTEPPSPTAQPPSATPTEPPPPTETALPACPLLRGVILPEKVACKDGPGAMYLFVYGLNQGATQDLIGRDDLGTWLLTRSHGDTLSCWVRADFLKTSTDPLCLPRIDPDAFGLPRSPYYAPPTGVLATRSGDVVTVTWNPVVLRPGDDSLQTPYVIEAWVCRAGQLLFQPVGAFNPSAKIIDEAGCSEPSHARLMAVEKHGFTLWIKIPWPPIPTPQP